MELSSYGITTRIDAPYDEAVEKVKSALKEEGFGILTEIDVQATLKQKLGIDTEKYVILGACNPPFAHRAITADPFVGLLLPCNVIVFEEGGKSVVSAMAPIAMMADATNEELQSVAREVQPRLERAIQNIGG